MASKGTIVDFAINDSNGHDHTGKEQHEKHVWQHRHKYSSVTWCKATFQ